MIDFTVSAHGTVVVLVPISTAAAEWCAGNLPADAPRWGAGFAIERRCFFPIAEGIIRDGLVFKLLSVEG